MSAPCPICYECGRLLGTDTHDAHDDECPGGDQCVCDAYVHPECCTDPACQTIPDTRHLELERRLERRLWIEAWALVALFVILTAIALGAIVYRLAQPRTAQPVDQWTPQTVAPAAPFGGDL